MNSIPWVFCWVVVWLMLNECVQAQVTVTGHIYAEVIEVLAATENTPLNFGSFSPEAGGGAITINPDGSRVTQGAVGMGSSLHNPASFLVSGQEDSSFSISLPTGPVALSNPEGTKSMMVTNWVSSPSVADGLTLAGGTLMIYVGATLNVGSMVDNPTGLYSGTYSIVFDYN